MARRHREKRTICPNCGTALRADFEFCPHCGQENHDLRVPFRHFAYEFVESITHFDTKLWNTLKAIFTRPGQLTLDYVEGRRARHVNPARFYIFVSVIFFALWSVWIDRGIEEGGRKVGNIPRAAAILPDMLPDSAMLPLGKDSALLLQLFLPIDSPWYGPMRERLVRNEPGLVDSLIATASRDTLDGVRARLAVAFQSLPEKSHLDVQRYVNSFIGHFTFPNKAEEDRFLRIGTNMTEEQADSILKADGDTTSSWFKRRAIRSVGHLEAGSIQGTQRLAHLVMKGVSVIMFVLMPFTALLLLWIFFRKRYYWEHLIFSIHIHTIFFLFFSLLIAVELLLPFKPSLWPFACVALLCVAYLLLSLRRVYGRSWKVTLFRTVLMSVPYVVVFFFLFGVGFFWGFLSM